MYMICLITLFIIGHGIRECWAAVIDLHCTCFGCGHFFDKERWEYIRHDETLLCNTKALIFNTNHIQDTNRSLVLAFTRDQEICTWSKYADLWKYTYPSYWKTLSCCILMHTSLVEGNRRINPIWDETYSLWNLFCCCMSKIFGLNKL